RLCGSQGGYIRWAPYCLLPTPMGRDLQGCPSRNSPPQAQRRLLQRVGDISSSASDSPRAAIYRTINDQLTLTDLVSLSPRVCPATGFPTGEILLAFSRPSRF